jgi:hypothetical protein
MNEWDQLRTHLHRGGLWWYLWILESKASQWYPVGKPPAPVRGKVNVYYGVHPTTGRKASNQRANIADVAAINCLFADFDAKAFGDKSRALAHIEQLTPRASVIVDSGGGYHCYWLLAETFKLTDAARERAKRTQAAWVAYVGGDTGAKDLARVLRVPGTLNYKYDPPRPVEFVRADFGQTYSLEELERAAQSAREGDVMTKQKTTHARGDGRTAYAEAALAGELAKLARTPEGARNTQLNASAYALGQLIGAGVLDRGEVEAQLEAVALAIGLSERETHATIRSGLEAGLREPREIPGGNGHEGHETNAEQAERAPSVEERIAALEAHIEQIPTDTDKVRLAMVLDPILQELAKLDKPIATMFLRSRIKERFGLVSAEVVAYESKLVRLRKEWERAEQARKAKEFAEQQAQAAKPKELSETERAEAIAFLQSPRIIEQTIDDITALGYVGEDENKLLVYLIATSRKQDTPLSATLKSPSAYGKSELVKTVSALMPPEDVLEFTRITPQAIAYMRPDALKAKWLIVTERNGSEGSDYNIRIIQSERKIKIAYPVKDPNTGEMHTAEREVLGPLAYTETTTRPTIHAENATRVFELYLDGSSAQTRRIHEAQRTRATLDGIRGDKKRAEIIRRHQNAQRLLQPVTVVIPYAEFINFPADNPRTRRDFPRFLETIKVIAFLRQYQKGRKRYTDPDGGILEYIEADLDDYRVAYQYAAPVIAYGLDELPKLSRDLFNKIVEMVKEKIAPDVNGERQFTRRDIQKHCGVTGKFIEDYIPLLEDKEYLEVVSGGKGKKYIYKLPDAFLTDQDRVTVKGLTTPDELAEAIRLAK